MASVAGMAFAMAGCDTRPNAPRAAAPATSARDGAADPAVRDDRASARGPAISSALTLASATAYSVRASNVSATVHGTVRGGTRCSADSMIVPTTDIARCRPFPERRVPSRNDGAGNAVVWLDGVTVGPANDAPRRAILRLAGCRLTPRVVRIAVGGTVQITSADAMRSELTFRDNRTSNPSVLVSADSIRDIVAFTDDGQTVPSTRIAARAGLVEVRDALHPWVRGWIAVSPHPFVAITADDGTFRFAGVPPGTYTVVVWHERLGQRTAAVRVTRSGEFRADVTFP